MAAIFLQPFVCADAEALMLCVLHTVMCKLYPKLIFAISDRANAFAVVCHGRNTKERIIIRGEEKPPGYLPADKWSW